MTHSAHFEDDATREGIAPEATDEQLAEDDTKHEAPKAARPKRPRKAPGSRKQDGQNNIVHLPHPTESDVALDGEARTELEAQGFSADEAIRIVHLSKRLAYSADAREAEASLRRLRFTRWLVEHGMLDEWSA